MIVTFEDILAPGTVSEIRDKLAESEFVDGKLTAGYRAKRVKKNEQLKWDPGIASEIQNKILDAIEDHKKLTRSCFPKRISTPLISKTTKGMGYGYHVDDAQIGSVGDKSRSDVSMTIFLSDPDDYEGGELEIITPYGMTAFKLPAGHAITYPSKFLHQVRTVTSGERLVAVCWMESFIRNEQDREILMELEQVNQKLHQLAPDAPETDLSFKVYANLSRRWVD